MTQYSNGGCARRRKMLFQALEHTGFCQKRSLGKAIAHFSEDRPEHRALRFCQTGLPTEPHHVPIGFPALKLPRVDHHAPFGPQEVRAELVLSGFGGRPIDQLPNLAIRGQSGRPEVGFVEAPADAPH